MQPPSFDVYPNTEKPGLCLVTAIAEHDKRRPEHGSCPKMYLGCSHAKQKASDGSVVFLYR